MKKLLPICILAAAILITLVLVIFKPDPKETSPERPLTQVEIIEVAAQHVQLTVQSQGTLMPTIETDLIAEVNGRIIEVADNFNAGNRFNEGDVLIKIDPADYEAAVASLQAELANAELALAQEEALAEQALADWKALGQGEPSDLTLRKPQLAQAQARIVSAEANLRKAERDLERTEIVAPYDGIILSKNVDLGQFITANPANPLATIYSTESAEIRLPITEREATLLDQSSRRQRFVQLTQDGAIDDAVWTAPLIRLEDNIDVRSRLLYAVARIPNPFEPGEGRPALRRGTFLQAEIEGRDVSDAYVIPRYALRGSNTVYIVTEAATAETREVTIVKSDAEEVVITDGLTSGERVITSPIAYYIEGMPVEVITDESHHTPNF